jgi:YfiH family protein
MPTYLHKMPKLHPDWLVPQWPAPSSVQAVFTTRAGGVSQGRYASLNLGDHVGDAPADVASNRARLQDALGVAPHFLQQVHGTACVALPEQAADVPAQADAVFTTHTGRACTVMVADCLPVLFTDRGGRFVAAAHAGWRGLAAGVLAQTLARVFQEFKSNTAQSLVAIEVDASEIIAWLGPCIGPQAFEVGLDVLQAYTELDPAHAAHFKPLPAGGCAKSGIEQAGRSEPSKPKYVADLAALARDQLKRLGVTEIHGNDSSPSWCTVSNSGFFSHRRDGISGRMAACIWLRG